MRSHRLVSCYSLLFSGFAVLGVVLLASNSVAQDSAARWSELGYPRLPEGFPDDDLTLFEGLNLACGKWTFEGESRQEGVATPVTAELNVTGSPVGGMYAGWAMVLRWSADSRDRTMQYTIMATPSKTGFRWGLFGIDLEALQKSAKTRIPAKPSHYKGSWNSDQRTIIWTEKPSTQREENPEETQRSFQMVVAADGRIEIKNANDLDGQRLVIGKAIEQTEKASEDKMFLSGKHRFQSADMVADPRIKPYLPRKATDVVIFSERGGHYARYKVTLDDFTEFLDELWKRDGDTSVQKRDEIDRERKPVGPSVTEKFREVAGWAPLEDAIHFSGPTKSNGAMTSFFYDRATGTVYHDRGYW
ncbi:MAG: hypothetical protein P8L85_08285 [Rubripirellula sp.]|nr:hypothetical protein [Rubripirellula sp.]